MTLTGAVLRVLLGGMLAWWVVVAARAPEVPLAATGAALVVAALTAWRPGVGLLATIAALPLGVLIAPAPARGAELFAAAFGAAWLLPLWRPLCRSSWPRGLVIPAALYAMALVASWLSLQVAAAAGISLTALVPHLFHAIPSDHLVFSVPEPETWVLLQTIAGIGLFLAAVGVTRDDPGFVRPLAWTIIGTAAALGVATLLDVVRQWSEAGYATSFLARYVSGERLALHLADMNAAGAWYALAAVATAAIAMLGPAYRTVALIALGMTGVAIWFTGSRSAYLAVTAGALVLAVGQRRWPLTQRHIAPIGTVLVVVLVGGAITSDWRATDTGTIAMSARLRSQFLVTPVRRFASAPLFGVGVGRYFDRSPEFMSEELRKIYGNENAHNYFAQQFAEIGLVGGPIFIWLVGAILICGWKAVRGRAGPEHLGLYAGAVGYLTTCVTGHPLLVPEAALPFWVAVGATAAAASAEPSARAQSLYTWVAAATAAVLTGGIATAAFAYASAPPAPPREHGFHEAVTDEGATFRWMVRHAVTYVPNETGFLHLRVRAPQETRPDRPLILETSLAGRVADRREVPSDRWFTYDIPVRRAASGPFQRVDLRVNQWWQQEVRLGRRRAMRPIAAMVAEARWIPLSEAGR